MKEFMLLIRNEIDLYGCQELYTVSSMTTE
jgi:hypothetical protein